MSKIGKWVKGKFSRASADGSNVTNTSQITEAQNALDKFTGELFEENNVVDNATQLALGRVQAATIAIALAYDQADQAGKKIFEEKKLITDNQFNGKKQVNTGIIFDAKKSVEDFSISEAKVQEWADALVNLGKEAGVTEEHVEKGWEINQTHAGVNPDKNATQAVPITPIYNALDKELGNVGKSIAVLHAAIRGGYGDIQTPNQKADRNFNIKVWEDDPALVKRTVRAAERLHSFINNKENAISPTPEDLKNIQDGVHGAINSIKESDAVLGDKADLSDLIKKAQEFADLTDNWKNTVDFSMKAPNVTEISESGFTVEQDDPEQEAHPDPMAKINNAADDAQTTAEQEAEQIAEKARSAFNGESKHRAANFDVTKKYLNALLKGNSGKVSKTPWEELQKNEFLPFLIAKTDITSVEDGKAVFTAKDNSYSFTVSADGVHHADKNSDVSAEEAIISAQLIKLNVNAANKGVTIGGNDEQKAMYYVAMKLEAPELIVNNQTEIDTIDPIIMRRAEQRLESLLDERKTSDGKPNYKGMVEEISGSAKPEKDVEKTPSAPTSEI